MNSKSKIKILIIYFIVMFVISYFFIGNILKRDEENPESSEITSEVVVNKNFESSKKIESEKNIESVESTENIESTESEESIEEIDNASKSEINITNVVSETNDNFVIESQDLQNNIISLEEGLKILNSDIENQHTIIKQIAINEHKKYVTNVRITGEVKEIRPYEIYLDNVKSGEKIYNNFIMSWDSVEEDKLHKLKKGDKATAVVTICKKNSDEYDRYSDDNERDFHIVRDSDLGKIDIHFVDSFHEDELEQKYSDKDKIYRFEDVYEDLSEVFSENYYRGMQIFANMKISANVKLDNLVFIYDNIYYVYKMENPILDNEKKYYEAIMNFLGYSEKQSQYAFSNESIVAYKIEKGKNASKEADLLAEFDRLKRNSKYEEKVFKLGSRNFDIKFTLLETENITVNSNSKINNIKELNLESFNDIYNNLEKIKVVGQDRIYVYDDCCFGHITMDVEQKIINPDTGVEEKTIVNKKVPLLWRVIKVDANDDNKLLLLLETPGVIDKMSWGDGITPVSYKDSTIRKFLNENFYNEHFDSQDKSKIYESEIVSTVYKSYYDNKVDYTLTTNDKVFILSSDEIKETKKFFFDQYQTSFIRDQRINEKMYSMYRRNIIQFPYGQGTKIDEYEQETHKLDEKWYVYPCIYVDAKVR